VRASSAPTPVRRYYTGAAPYTLLGASRLFPVQLAPHPAAVVSLARSWRAALLPRREELSAIAAVLESRIGAEDVATDAFVLEPPDSVRFPCLARLTPEAARAAVRDVRAFNTAVAPLLPLVDPDARGAAAGSPGRVVTALRGLLWYSRKARLLHAALRSSDVTAGRATPLHFNRMRAVAVAEAADGGGGDAGRRSTGEGSLFWQAFEVHRAVPWWCAAALTAASRPQVLNGLPPATLRRLDRAWVAHFAGARVRANTSHTYIVHYRHGRVLCLTNVCCCRCAGEGAMDLGGPYRESLCAPPPPPPLRAAVHGD
jgi:hypothetical protein